MYPFYISAKRDLGTNGYFPPGKRLQPVYKVTKHGKRDIPVFLVTFTGYNSIPVTKYWGHF
jgi:hypothetical protein